jgi:rhodanese-related sulfurtransferase
LKNLTPSELADYLADQQPLLCHLEGAKLVPMQQVPAWAEYADKDQEIVVICHHGIRSRQVAMYLEHLGFKRVINLAGGVQDWARDVDPQMPTY